MSGNKLLKGVIAAAMVGSDPLDASGEPRRRIQLLPFGEFQLRGHSATVRLDKAGAPEVIEASRAFLGRTDMMVDRDHQSIFGAVKGVGGQAAAAGWIKPDSLAIEDDGIWADVEWTSAAQEQLKSKEYRYLSPVFTTDDSGRVTRIHNVALTNSPAIEELAAAATQTHEGDSVSFKKIAVALGLGEDATEDAICASIGKMQTSATAIQAALGVKDGGDLVAAAQTLKAAGAPDPAKFAPIEVVQQLQTEVTALKTASVSGAATTAVDEAIKAGKILPASRDFWVASATADLAAFEGYVKTAPAIVAPGERKLPGEAPTVRTTLTDVEKTLAASMGLAEDKFLANLVAAEASR